LQLHKTVQLIIFSSLTKTLNNHKKLKNTRWNEKNTRFIGKTLGVAPLAQFAPLPLEAGCETC